MTPVPAALAWTRRLESLSALDPVVRTVRPLADALVADPARRDLLRGAWLGHPLHPVLTDLPIGLWTSATVLDLVGGRSARPAATRLVGLGLLAAGAHRVERLGRLVRARRAASSGSGWCTRATNGAGRGPVRLVLAGPPTRGPPPRPGPGAGCLDGARRRRLPRRTPRGDQHELTGPGHALAGTSLEADGAVARSTRTVSVPAADAYAGQGERPEPGAHRRPGRRAARPLRRRRGRSPRPGRPAARRPPTPGDGTTPGSRRGRPRRTTGRRRRARAAGRPRPSDAATSPAVSWAAWSTYPSRARPRTATAVSCGHTEPPW